MQLNDLMAVVMNYDQDAKSRSIYSQLTCEKYMVDSSGKIKVGFQRSDFSYYTGNFNKACEIFLKTNKNYCLFICSDIEGNFRHLIKCIEDTKFEFGVYSPMLSGNYHKYWYDKDNPGQVRSANSVDGVCFVVNRLVIEKLYPFVGNQLGWGLDMLKCFTSHKMKLPVVVDNSITMHHPFGSNYNKKEAEIQLELYLDRNEEFKKFCQSKLRVCLPIYKRVFFKCVNFLKGEGYSI